MRALLVVGPSIPCFLREQGLDLIHRPVIRLESLVLSDAQQKVLQTVSNHDALIMTSQYAVKCLYECLKNIRDLPVFCVGEHTAESVRKLFPSVDVMISNHPTQEGLVEAMLQSSYQSFFWPRSEAARSYLSQEIRMAGRHLTELELYRPVPCNVLSDFSFEGVAGVFFTCPSSVDAFFSFVVSPPDVHYYAIGPVTAARLKKYRVVPELFLRYAK